MFYMMDYLQICSSMEKKTDLHAVELKRLCLHVRSFSSTSCKSVFLFCRATSLQVNHHIKHFIDSITFIFSFYINFQNYALFQGTLNLGPNQHTLKKYSKVPLIWDQVNEL